MFFQVRLYLLVSPRPTKAQVQRCKSFFQLQMKKHIKSKQMYDYKRRRKQNKTSSTISSTMQRPLCCTCSLRFPPFFLPFLLILISFPMWLDHFCHLPQSLSLIPHRRDFTIDLQQCWSINRKIGDSQCTYYLIVRALAVADYCFFVAATIRPQ